MSTDPRITAAGRRVVGTDHLAYHSDPIARSDGTLRVDSAHHGQSCLVDIDAAKLRVTRTICQPRERGWPSALTMSLAGDRVAWITEDGHGTRTRLRAMELATRRIVVDTAAIDFTAVLDDKQQLISDAGRIYVGVGTSGFIVETTGAARRVTHDPELRDCRVVTRTSWCVSAIERS